MYCVRLIVSISAIILAGLAIAPARAAATHVIENESLARSPYQSVEAVCINVAQGSCTLKGFTPVPAGKSLVVVNVSCGWSLVHPSTIAATQLAATSGDTPLHYLPVQFVGSLVKSASITLDNYIFDVQTSAVYTTGQTPEIVITTNGTVTWAGGFCSVTGYLAG
jgi:hypothetical protein